MQFHFRTFTTPEMLGKTSNIVPPAWQLNLSEAIGRKRGDVIAHIASLRPNGTPCIMPLNFQKFLPQDPRLLIFSSVTRDAELMSSLKHTPVIEISFVFPDRGETFIVSGKLLPVTAPTLAHRFGRNPRKYHLKEYPFIQGLENIDGFWEDLRLDIFKSIDNTARARLTWPSPGEVREDGHNRGLGTSEAVQSYTGIDYGFKHLKLDVTDDSLAKRNSLVNGDPKIAVINAAYENLCLLILKPQRVDLSRKGSGSKPGTRIEWQWSADSGKWMAREINPYM